MYFILLLFAIYSFQTIWQWITTFNNTEHWIFESKFIFFSVYLILYETINNHYRTLMTHSLYSIVHECVLFLLSRSTIQGLRSSWEWSEIGCMQCTNLFFVSSLVLLWSEKCYSHARVIHNVRKFFFLRFPPFLFQIFLIFWGFYVESRLMSKIHDLLMHHSSLKCDKSCYFG